ncbi:right-handed parallel beta-helix repeat-containing protein [Roseiconus lacunae]|uniref:right-handed parallel beta-helix repeat-containing protein n=1 Tax=Roseiconus lacunae TaxID=2605694 RepID=UPI0011F260AD|nr:right-handed parallel beta-helix repeat-containing protein [Roseiconus lacunae]
MRRARNTKRRKNLSAHTGRMGLPKRRHLIEALEDRRVLANFSGLSGDIIEIRLSDHFDGIGDQLPGLADSNDATLFLPSQLGLPPLEQSRTFFVAPHIDSGTIVVDLMIDHLPETIEIDIQSGFSIDQPAAVTFGNQSLDALRVQQRLRSLGYVGPTGDEVPLSASFDTATKYSIGLFNAASTGNPLTPSSDIRRDLINSIDAPRWIELDVAAINTTADGVHVLPNLDGSDQTERFISSRWVQASSSQTSFIPFLADDAQADNDVAQQDRLELRRGSLPYGGPVGGEEFDGDHHGGLELDFETPSTNDSTAPFFAYQTIDGIRYVSGSSDQLVFLESGTYVEAPAGTYPLDQAVQVEIPGDTENSLSAWNNRDVLSAIRDYLQDNASVGYDVGRIRNQFLTLLQSGVNYQEPRYVDHITYNDPRTWISADGSEWNGDGLNGPVRFGLSNNGVFQVNLVPFVEASDVQPDSAVVLVDGLSQLTDVFDSIENSALFQTDIPLVQQDYGNFVPLAETLQHAIHAPLESYFASTTSPSTDEIIDLFKSSANAVDGVLFQVQPNSVTGGRYLHDEGNELRFGLTVTATQTHPDVPVDLGAAWEEANLHLHTPVLIDLEGRVTLDLSFGVGLSTGEEFFFDIDDLQTSVQASHQALDFDLNVGVLGTEVVGGTIDLQTGIEVQLNDALQDQRGRIDGATIQQGLTLEELFQFSTETSAEAQFPMSATLGDFSTSGTNPHISVVEEDAFDDVDSTIVYSDFDEIIHFRNLTATEVQEMLSSTLDWQSQWNDLLEEPQAVPFGWQLTTENLFDTPGALSTAIESKLISEGQPSFSTLQELVALLDSEIAHYGYDPSTGEFSIGFEFQVVGETFQNKLDLVTLPHDPLAGQPFPDHLQLPLIYPQTVTEGSFVARDEVAFEFGINVPASSGPTQPEHFYIDDSHIAGVVDLAAGSITMDGQYGFLDVLSNHGEGNSTFSVALDGINSRYHVNQSPPVVTAKAGGAASFELKDFRPADGAFIVDGDDTAYFTWSDFADLSTRDLDVPAEFLCYQHVGYTEIVQSLRAASDFINDAVSDLPSEGNIPLVNGNFSDVHQFASDFEAAVTELENFPAQSIGKAEAKIQETLADLLGIAPSASESIEVDLSLSCEAIQIEIEIVDELINRVDAVSIDVGGYSLLGGDSHTNLTLVTDLVVGVDLSNPSNPRSYVDAESQVELELKSHAEALSGAMTLGPIGVTVSDGRVAIDADGLGSSEEPATFGFYVSGDAGDRFYAPSFVGNSIEFDHAGEAGTDLPLYYPDPSTPMGGVDEDDGSDPGDDLDDYPENHVVFVQTDLLDASTAELVEHPPVESLFADFSLLGALENGINQLLGLFGSKLGSQWSSFELPLVGNGLAQGNSFAAALTSTLASSVQNIESNAIAEVQQLLYNGFVGAGLTPGDISGPEGTPDGNSDYHDVVADNSDDFIQFDVQLVRSLSAFGANIPLDIGLPLLGFDIEGDIPLDAGLGFTWNLGFGVSEQDGFYLTHSDSTTPEFVADFGIEIPDAEINAQFGLLSLSVEDNDASPSNLGLETSLDFIDPTPGDHRITLSELRNSSSWDFSYDGGVSLNLHLASRFDTDYFPGFETDFVLELPIVSSDDTENELRIQFQNATIDLGGFATTVVKPLVEQAELMLRPLDPLLDVILEPIPILSDFSALASSLGCHDIGDTVEIADAISCLSSVSPWFLLADTVISVRELLDNLRGSGGSLHYHLGDLDLTESTDPRRQSFSVDRALETLESIDVAAALDSLEATGLAANSLDAIKESFHTVQDRGRGLYYPILENPASAFGLLFNKDVDLAVYDLPRFEGSGNLPGGRFTIYPNFDVDLKGDYEYLFDVDLAYDTRGLREIIDSGRPADLLNGLYLTDFDDSGNDKIEVELGFSYKIRGGYGVDFANIVELVDASASGRLRTLDSDGTPGTLKLDLRDIDEDGKVRFNEMASLLGLANGDPTGLFDLSGRLVGELVASVWAGFEVQIFAGHETKEVCFATYCKDVPDLSRPKYRTVKETFYENEWEFLHQVILDLDDLNVGGLENSPTLAELDDGTLWLNVGDRASLRSDDATDSSESYQIKQTSTELIVEAYGVSQSFPLGDVSLIRADFGLGEDSLLVDQSVSIGGVFSGGEKADSLIYRGSSNVVLYGDGGDDRLEGSDGGDTIRGGTGSDTILGGAGNDTIYGESGNDKIAGGLGNDKLYGGADNDQIAGDAGDDTIEGNSGRDQISGGGGDDVIDGGDDDDRLFGDSGLDTIDGGAGDDLIDGGDDADTIHGGADDDNLLGGSGTAPDTIDGGTGNDSIRGGGGDDVLRGGDGDDRLFGEEGDDRLEGQSGDDSLYGEQGNDVLLGGIGSDILSGGSGNDNISGGDGVDTGIGGDGDDVLHGDDDADVLSGGDGNDQLFGGAGEDVLDGGDDNDAIEGGLGDDVIDGARGNDELDGGGGNDILFGGSGNDIIHGDSGDDWIRGSLGDDEVTGGDGNDLIEGGSGNDSLQGNAGQDTIFGDGGDDVLSGDDDNDIVRGGSGDDTIGGGRGNDELSGESGSDTISGGEGTDQIKGGPHDDLLFGGADDDDILGETGDDRIQAGTGNDTVDGGTGDDLIGGGSGNDQLLGNVGNDRIDAGDGDDFVDGGRGDDIAEGGAGDDTIEGGDGDDRILGGPGSDLLSGGDGHDYIDGGSGVDTIAGEAGDDTIDAGPSVGDTLLGGDGDDTLIGSDLGSEIDPDFADDQRFGDYIDAGAGNDLIRSFGGADYILGGEGNDQINAGSGADFVLGGIGNDTIDVGAGTGDQADGEAGEDTIYGSVFGSDRLRGGMGDDRLFGYGGADQLWGGPGNDWLNGGTGVDLLAGEEDNDELHGGGGAGDQLLGGEGNDVLYGSEDGADIASGGPGKDAIFGYGGNDQLRGDEGDDQIWGGDGDDFIEGGPGTDTILGESHHDQLYGHTADGVGDDAAVDYLYGDFGIGTISLSAPVYRGVPGRDQLFGGGGNDILFGEEEDDAIDAGNSSGDTINFGDGESIDPSAYLPPTATDAPAVAPAIPDASQSASLPDGSTEPGIWNGVDGSASADGVSGRVGIASGSVIAVDGTARYVAWNDDRSGVFQIYVAKHDTNTGWIELDGSAGFGGISNSETSSTEPSIVIDTLGNPIVAWTERSNDDSWVRAMTWDSNSETWLPLSSMDSGLVSTGNRASAPQVISTPNGPLIAYIDEVTGIRDLTAMRYNGVTKSWHGVDGSTNGFGVCLTQDVIDFSLAQNGDLIAVSFTREHAEGSQIHVKEFDGLNWNDLSTSESTGVSGSAIAATSSTVAYHDSDLYLAWSDALQEEDFGAEIFVRRYVNGQWEEAAPGAASGVGLSGERRPGLANASSPQLISHDNVLSLTWLEQSFADDEAHVVTTRFDGSTFQPMASPGTSIVSSHQGTLQSLATAAGDAGQLWMTWTEFNGSTSVVRAITSGSEPIRTFVADAAQSVADILAAENLGPGDRIFVTVDQYDPIDVAQSDSGVEILAGGDIAIHASVTVSDASNVTFQGFRFSGTLNVNSASNLTIRDSIFSGPTFQIRDGVGLRFLRNEINSLILLEGEGDGLTFSNNHISRPLRFVGNQNDVTIEHNTFSQGVLIASPVDGMMRHNHIAGTLDLQAAWTGAIRDNQISDSSVGVRYGADADLFGNRIENNSVGVVVSGGTRPFGSAGANWIINNNVGVELDQTSVVMQQLDSNTIGVQGVGDVGLQERGNLISGSNIGVNVTGAIIGNELRQNEVAVQAHDNQWIRNNLFQDNSLHLEMKGTVSTRVHNNTFLGIGTVDLRSATREAELIGNLFGFGSKIEVNSGSEAGYFADYNVLSEINYLGHQFDDVLDWRIDLGQFDQHSYGVTRVSPTGVEPIHSISASVHTRQVSSSANQRRTSVAIDGGHPLVIWPEESVRQGGSGQLLLNPSFEDDLSEWTQSPTLNASIQTSSAFGGNRSLNVISSATGSLSQVIDLVGNGVDVGHLDASRLDAIASLRLRLGDGTEDSTTLRLEIEFRAADQSTIDTVLASSSVTRDRWHIVGGRFRIPAQTRSIVYRIVSEGAALAGQQEWIDDASLVVIDDQAGMNIGARSATTADVSNESSGPRLYLRSPDLYVDWNSDVPKTIRWDSFDIPDNEAIRIDVYQDTAGGPTLLTNIAAATGNDGEFSWTPATSGITEGTHGLRLQLSMVNDPIVFDRSLEVFSVPEGTNQFFVNDDQLIDDGFTSAVGDHRNTGRLASSPKPSVNSILDAYSIGAGDTLSIDTGHYSIFRPIIISNQSGVGDDEGFTLRGSLAGETSLTHAFSTTLAPVISLVDADYLVISDFVLFGGTYGVHSDSQSENNAISRLRVSNNAADGIYLGGTQSGRLSEIESFNNGGRGIWIAGGADSITSVVAGGNGDDGLRIDGAVSEVSHSLFHDNDGAGLYLQSPANSVVQANQVYRNAKVGIDVGQGDSSTLIGATDLAMGLGNLVFENGEEGISVYGGVRVVGNTVYGHGGTAGIEAWTDSVIRNNVLYDNRTGIDADVRVLVAENRIFNSSTGIRLEESAAQGNVIYSSSAGITSVGSRSSSILNNLIYDVSSAGINGGGSGVVIRNNTIDTNASGPAITLISADVSNNIIRATNGSALGALRTDYTFDSDFNLFSLGEDAFIGTWAGAARDSLDGWSQITGFDQNSIIADPMFVDPAGADGVIGASGPALGFDDDYHLQSLYGSFHSGALAPILDSETGLPIFAPGVLTLDTRQSPGIDRGDLAVSVADEPTNNGGVVNLGAFGGTIYASKSASEYLLVTQPGSSAVWPIGQSFDIEWRTSQVDGTVDVSLIPVGGGDPILIADGSPNNGILVFDVATDIPLGDYYVRVAGDGDSIGVSVGTVTIAGETNSYYVNLAADADLTDNQYTTAAGSEAADGLTPQTPAASIRQILNNYDLGDGDTIFVDTGVYEIDTEIAIDLDDSGVTISGPTDEDKTAVIDRGGSGTAFLLEAADDITLSHLAITRAEVGVSIEAIPGNSAYRNRIVSSEIYDNEYGILMQHGSLAVIGDVIIENNVIRNNSQAGVYHNSRSSNGIVVRGNQVYENRDGIHFTSYQSNWTLDVLITQNEVYSNTITGIRTHGSEVVVEDNRVYSHYRTSDTQFAGTGVILSGSIARENEVFQNYIGMSGGSLVEENSIFGNDIGLIGSGNATRNKIFGNLAGLMHGTNVTSNLFYNNQTVSIGVTNARLNAVGNTIFQPQGDAISISNTTGTSELRNNIISVGSGTAIQVDEISQSNFISDYNQFDLGDESTFAIWGDTTFTSQTDWVYELGLDSHSIFTAPGFIDPNGADDVLGGTIVNTELVTGGESPWTFSGLIPGRTYQLAVSVSNASNQWNILHHNVTDDDGNLATIQRSKFGGSDEFEADGYHWTWIGTFQAKTESLSLSSYFSRGSLPIDAVRLDELAIADAGDDDFHLAGNAPGIDRGDPTLVFDNEPLPNGARVNLGAYGNTDEATRSATQTLQVLSPTGFEKWETGSTNPVQFVGVGLPDDATASIDISVDLGQTWTEISNDLTLVTGQVNYFSWTIPDGLATDTPTAMLRIRSGSIQVASTPFAIVSEGSQYYVNVADDVDFSDNQYTSAAGDNSNSGKRPDAPMASLAALLRVYELHPGDTVYVDTGHYQLQSDILLGPQHSGVTITGPSDPAKQAVIERGNTLDSSDVFELFGTSDVTISHLTMTGAYNGIHLVENSGNTDTTINSNSLHGNIYGITADRGNSDVSVVANQLDGNDNGMYIAAVPALVSENEVFHNDTGIHATDPGGGPAESMITVQNNEVFANQNYGIITDGARSLVIENRVYGNRQTGIRVEDGAQAIANDVFQNANGVMPLTDAMVQHNAIHGNTYGIWTNRTVRDYPQWNPSVIEQNTIFGNRFGIYLAPGGYSHQALIRSNLIYGSFDSAIEISKWRGHYNSQGGIFGNTIRHTGSDAINLNYGEIASIRFEDNIFSVSEGSVFSIASFVDLSEFSSDYNLFDLSNGASIATWSGIDTTSLLDWRLLYGKGQHSLFADPQFVDVDGADNVLGLDVIPVEVIDNGDSGFSQEGDWTLVTGDGYGDDYLAGHRSQSESATWTFDGLTPGKAYRLAVTFVPHESRAQYAISDDSGVLASVTYDQEHYGDDNVFNNGILHFYRDGFAWTQLGTYVPTGSQLVVSMTGLNIGAHQFFPTADAVRIDEIIPPQTIDDDFRLGSSSAGIDRANPLSGFFSEPNPNGARRNIGAYGNTDSATTSNIQTIRVNSPSGDEKLFAGNSYPIEFDSAGLTDTVTLELSTDMGVSWMEIATDVPVNTDGSGIYQWHIPESYSTVDITALIRARSGSAIETAMSPFQIVPARTAGENAFYINVADDTNFSDNQYTTASGDNRNSGRSPDRPMSSLEALLRVYDLEPGDVIYVDTGDYELLANLLISDNDSGVTITGPTEPDKSAVIRRGNGSEDAAVFEIVGASNVTLSNLGIADGYYGIWLPDNKGSSQLRFQDNEIFSNQYSGIQAASGNVGVTIIGNEVHENGTYGILAESEEMLIQGNRVLSNDWGVLASDTVEVRGNEVLNNVHFGIYLSDSSAIAIDNQVWGHRQGSSFAGGVGIYGVGTIVGNTTYDNDTGIVITSGAIAEDNRIYGNQTGLWGREWRESKIIGNAIYSNSQGIFFSGTGNYGAVVSNLIYANTNQAVLLDGFGRDYEGDNGLVTGNTIHQAVGNAVTITSSYDRDDRYDSKNIRFFNNIVTVENGAAFAIANDSLSGWQSDYNLISLGGGTSANYGTFGDVLASDLTAWQDATGMASHSQQADPLFVDRNGIDNQLGYINGVDYGQDDNWALYKGSPAIDAGDLLKATAIDYLGSDRRDDPGTVNMGAIDYAESAFVEVGYAAIGVSLNLGSSEFATVQYSLPFDFPYFGRVEASVNLSNQGLLQFGSDTNLSWTPNAHERLHSETMNRVTAMWQDIHTGGAGDGVFVDDSVADQVTFHWNATSRVDGADVRFAVTLHRSGDFGFHYGLTGGLAPVAGYAVDGAYTVSRIASSDGMTTGLDNKKLSFITTSGYIDLGAIEFRGDSDDVLPPLLVSATPDAITTGGQTSALIDSFQIQFSEEVNYFDARSFSAYELREAGINGMFGDADDTVFVLTPSFGLGESFVHLQLDRSVLHSAPSATMELSLEGPLSTDDATQSNDSLQYYLPEGNYRFELHSDVTGSIHDASGLSFDGDGDGQPGGKFTQEFEVRFAPEFLTLDLTPSIFEGQNATLAGQFRDISGGAIHTLLIDWEDGAPVESISIEAGEQSFSIDHRYVDDSSSQPSGSFQVTATLLNDIGRQVTNTELSITVANFTPSIDSVVAPLSVAEFETFVLSGAITDLGTNDALTLAIDWGYGLVEHVELPAGINVFSVEHAYVDVDFQVEAIDQIISISVSDGNATSSDVNKTIELWTSNSPPRVNDQLFEITENSPGGTVVGQVLNADPDLVAPGQDTQAFSIVGGTGIGLFEIDPSGVIRSTGGSVLDYEHVTSYSLYVEATDGRGATDLALINIALQNQIEVVSATVDDGTAQRSVVRSLTIRFDAVVTLSADAIEIETQSGETIAPIITTHNELGRTIATLTFAGDMVDASGALLDGRYSIRIQREKIESDSASVMASDFVDDFFRLLGDGDGDQDVDASDLARFSRTLNQYVGDEAFDPSYDFDGDGDVDAHDLARFRRQLMR